MNSLVTYQKKVQTMLSSIDTDSIDAAARYLYDAVCEDKLIHIFGTDPHASAVSDEMFFRGGSLQNVDPIYDPSLDLEHGAYRSAMCLPLKGLAEKIMNYYEYIDAGDPIIIISQNSKGQIFTDALSKAKEMGLKIIAITNNREGVDADVCISIDCAYDDRCIEIGNVRAGSVTTVIFAAILNMLNLRTIELLNENGKEIPVWNETYSVSENKDAIYKYLDRIRHL